MELSSSKSKIFFKKIKKNKKKKLHSAEISYISGMEL